MKKFVNTLSSDKIILWSTLISTLLFLVSIGCIIIFYQSLPPYIPLFHQVPWGIERLGRKVEFFLPCLYVFIVFILNLILAYHTHEKMPLVSRIIAITTLLLNIILCLFTIRSIQLVI